jgi:hypothetical protein
MDTQNTYTEKGSTLAMSGASLKSNFELYKNIEKHIKKFHLNQVDILADDNKMALSIINDLNFHLKYYRFCKITFKESSKDGSVTIKLQS